MPTRATADALSIAIATGATTVAPNPSTIISGSRPKRSDNDPTGYRAVRVSVGPFTNFADVSTFIDFAGELVDTTL